MRKRDVFLFLKNRQTVTRPLLARNSAQHPPQTLNASQPPLRQSFRFCLRATARKLRRQLSTPRSFRSHSVAAAGRPRQCSDLSSSPQCSDDSASTASQPLQDLNATPPSILSRNRLFQMSGKRRRCEISPLYRVYCWTSRPLCQHCEHSTPRLFRRFRPP